MREDVHVHGHATPGALPFGNRSCADHAYAPHDVPSLDPVNSAPSSRNDESDAAVRNFVHLFLGGIDVFHVSDIVAAPGQVKSYLSLTRSDYHAAF
jgi:hypothetical protein